MCCNIKNFNKKVYDNSFFRNVDVALHPRGTRALELWTHDVKQIVEAPRYSPSTLVLHSGEAWNWNGLRLSSQTAVIHPWYNPACLQEFQHRSWASCLPGVIRGHEVPLQDQQSTTNQDISWLRPQRDAYRITTRRIDCPSGLGTRDRREYVCTP